MNLVQFCTSNRCFDRIIWFDKYRSWRCALQNKKFQSSHSKTPCFPLPNDYKQSFQYVAVECVDKQAMVSSPNNYSEENLYWEKTKLCQSYSGWIGVDEILTTIACSRLECSNQTEKMINESWIRNLPIFFNQIVACRRR